ncbi:MAG: PEP-CTERM sorting domain-containing protein [Armatimonadetes bacterium]|nr:PEP-CTERM sorting domain-containing protein [Armatimonadota bacterium]
MTKTCFLLLALLLACSPVLGGVYTIVIDGDKWEYEGDICVADVDLQWEYALNGDDLLEIHPVSPEGDPRIRQTIVNNTQDTWTDWHMTIVNAYNLRGIKVYDTAHSGNPSLWWTIEDLQGAMGFFAHVTTTGDPNNPQAIHPGQSLYVEFTYDVAVQGQVRVTQYPTTWYPIPEPASIMTLLAGIGAMGFGAIRRARKK